MDKPCECRTVSVSEMSKVVNSLPCRWTSASIVRGLTSSICMSGTHLSVSYKEFRRKRLGIKLISRRSKAAAAGQPFVRGPLAVPLTSLGVGSLVQCFLYRLPKQVLLVVVRPRCLHPAQPPLTLCEGQ